MQFPEIKGDLDARFWTIEDWRRVERLRASFFELGCPTRWEDERDFQIYDSVFGRRIGVKVLRVFELLESDGWRPKSRVVWDWGCGTGFVSMLFTQKYGMEAVYLHDCYAPVMEYARRRHENCGWQVFKGVPSGKEKEVLLLISHVLSELSSDGEKNLRLAIEKCGEIFWVEPGNWVVSRKLLEFREYLNSSGWKVISPCPHFSPCPMKFPERQKDWCHFFARPVDEFFHSAHWRLVSEWLGLDLRSLSFSYLVATKDLKSKPLSEEPRWLGRARITKHDFEVDLCCKEGWKRQKFRKRDGEMGYRKLRRHPELFSGEALDPGVLLGEEGRLVDSKRKGVDGMRKG
ncbi:MAG: small ribosomal subunit Rsm22 family protein [Chthoniobacterales bacterium]|nr:small ribosomal subunit Rsm22 family protein [Chthoniobacterales bacterium]